jgi:hypothetical protein
MIKSFGLSAALLLIVLLMSSGYASAGTNGPLVPVSARSAAQINAVNLAVNPYLILTNWANLMYTDGGEGDKGDDKDKDKDKGKGGDDDDDDHTPTPEPATILSFGAALLIGGGVLYSRRLRRNRK